MPRLLWSNNQQLVYIQTKQSIADNNPHYHQLISTDAVRHTSQIISSDGKNIHVQVNTCAGRCDKNVLVLYEASLSKSFITITS